MGSRIRGGARSADMRVVYVTVTQSGSLKDIKYATIYSLKHYKLKYSLIDLIVPLDKRDLKSFLDVIFQLVPVGFVAMRKQNMRDS